MITPSNKRRKAFSASPGNFVTAGSPAEAAHLQAALNVSTIDWADPRSSESLLTHLFHSYAARTNPLTVRTILRNLPAGIVFDPFVGSGTTLLEAMLWDHQGFGMDLNELAIRLAFFKTHPLKPRETAMLYKTAQTVAELSFERVEKRQKPRQLWDTAKYYEPHIYLELCGLREEIEVFRERSPQLFQDLLLIFSSIVLKASKLQSETNATLVKKALRKGQISQWFVDRAREVAHLHDLLCSKLARKNDGAYLPDFAQADARQIPPDFLPETGVDTIFTSPPYLGVYDYATHHERRCAWLEIETRPMRAEIGSRRRSLAHPREELLQKYFYDTKLWLQQSLRVHKAGGMMYVMIGDSVLQGELLEADQLLGDAAQQVGYRFIASCSTQRTTDSEDESSHIKFEHLLQFQKKE